MDFTKSSTSTLISESTTIMNNNQQIPQAILYRNAATAPMHPCMECGRDVRSDLPDIYCYRHRNNRNPEDGWIHVKANEFVLLNLIRRNRLLNIIFSLIDSLIIAEDDNITDDESVAVLTAAAGSLAVNGEESGDEF